MQPGSMYQSSFRSCCSCPYPSCVNDRNSEHICRPPVSYQKSSESHLRLQASSLLQMPGDPRLYAKSDRSPFYPASAAFGVLARPSGFYVPSSHCLTSQQLFFPFSDASQARQHGGLPAAFRDKPETKKRRKRTIFTTDQLKRMESAFERQQYLVGSERERLARDLNLSETQVKIWFQNRRIKWRKEHLYAGAANEMEGTDFANEQRDICN